MNKCRRFLLGLLVASISGCATPKEYRSDASHPIRSITVAENVPAPKKMTFVGFSESMIAGIGGATGGAVGGAIAAGFNTWRPGSEAFHIGQATRAEYIAEIEKSRKFVVKKSGPADAVLQLEVTGYGFYQAGMFARRVRPILSVEAKLLRADGTLVWQHRRAVTHLTNETPALLPEKIRDNPQLGADALRAAARVCARNAVESLKQ